MHIIISFLEQIGFGYDQASKSNQRQINEVVDGVGVGCTVEDIEGCVFIIHQEMQNPASDCLVLVEAVFHVKIC